MDVKNDQNFCIYCKRKLIFREESFHETCYNEVYNFNQHSETELDMNTYQIQLLSLILVNTSLQLNEVLTLKKKDIDLENKQINFVNKIFKLTDSKYNDVLNILKNLPTSEELFPLKISYPSRFLFSSSKKEWNLFV